MTELIHARGKDFDPISEIARLTDLYIIKTRELRELNESRQGLGIRPDAETRGLPQKLAEEVVWIKGHYGISDEDFFEALTQTRDWKDRITYGKEGSEQ